jgi:ribosomal protein S18 acetylase RimI-like enzyme
MLTISLHSGSREPLAPLFSEADDSKDQIATYRDLGSVFTATDEGRIVGHVQIIELDEPGIFEIKSLAVAADRRRRGIGAALVEAALAWCRESGAQSVSVATAAASIEALKFYQRLGFRFSRIIRDFYSAERGYRPLELDGIPLRDEVILDFEL